MDPIMYEHPRRPKPKRGDTATGDLFGEQPSAKPDRGAPYQASSDTSREAAESIAPHFGGNRLICLRAIAEAGDTGTTRKAIAARHFEGMQHYVTGPVAVLLEQKLVRERTRLSLAGQAVLPEKRDGSTILLITEKGLEALADA